MPFVFPFVRKGWHRLYYLCRDFEGRTDNVLTQVCRWALTTQQRRKLNHSNSLPNFLLVVGPGAEKKNPGDHQQWQICVIALWIIHLQGIMEAQWFPTFPISLVCSVPGMVWAWWLNTRDLCQLSVRNSSADRYPSPLAGQQDREGLITFQRL